MSCDVSTEWLTCAGDIEHVILFIFHDSVHVCLHAHQRTNLLSGWQEYWNQPARQIVRRYRQRQQQQQARAAFADGGDGGLVLTRSLQLHECGYPDCGKTFRHKQHLLRHQTQKHGRLPTRVLGLQRVWMKPDDMNSGQNFDTTGTCTAL